MEKGSVIPNHGHKHFEETLMLKGSVDCGGTIIEAGDYVKPDRDAALRAVAKRKPNK